MKVIIFMVTVFYREGYVLKSAKERDQSAESGKVPNAKFPVSLDV